MRATETINDSDFTSHTPNIPPVSNCQKCQKVLRSPGPLKWRLCKSTCHRETATRARSLHNFRTVRRSHEPCSFPKSVVPWNEYSEIMSLRQDCLPARLQPSNCPGVFTQARAWFSQT